MFGNLLNLTPTTQSLSWLELIFALLLAIILSLIVAIVYKNTHRGLSYSQSFLFALILIGFLLSAIMMVIGNSLAIAFGAFGAFSLIRFRTAIKDSKDIAFILLVVSIGLAVGTHNYMIAIVVTILAVLMIYILTKINFGSIRKYDYILSFSAKTDSFSNETMRDIFMKFLKSDNLLNVSSRDNGQVLDYNFNVRFIKSEEKDNFVKELGQLGGIINIDLISTKNDIEY